MEDREMTSVGKLCLWTTEQKVTLEVAWPTLIFLELTFVEERRRFWVTGWWLRKDLMHGPSSYSVYCEDTEGAIIDFRRILKNKLTYSILMLTYPILDRRINIIPWRRCRCLRNFASRNAFTTSPGQLCSHIQVVQPFVMLFCEHWMSYYTASTLFNAWPASSS